ncbi:hypothetical protein [Agromyces soli]|uniref:Uncharacterized protein n=1 Tax=Agromyces soli TaxID=659012 RepID=A0ABY4AYL6_9MICO|nr:hypothetical protein [Agromyces soli]UOE27517.1 hypothetical protein MTP13_06995 [Agromyces soli]
MTEPDELADLPVFTAWRSQYVPPLDEVSYLATHLEVTSAALFAKLMTPEFVAVRGCVLVKDRFSPERFEEWMTTAHGSTVVVERALNRLYLWDVFETASEAEERALVRLAERMAVSWKLHAMNQFPDREFEAEVTDDYGPTVVLWSTSGRRCAVSDRVGEEVV